MLDAGNKPTPASVSHWIGVKNYVRWRQIVVFIETNYPDTFEIKWLYGGRKYGWVLRYKKSKSFCSLIPEQNRFKILLVFGGEERKMVEPLLPQLVSHVRDDYASATTYHDGRWVVSVVDSDKVLTDVEKLLLLKRKPTHKLIHADG